MLPSPPRVLQKYVLEVELQRRVCHDLLVQAEAEREGSDDWAAADMRHVALVAAPESPDQR